MEHQNNTSDIDSDLDTEILERIRAYRDAKNQELQAEGSPWVDNDLLDYSIRGLEAIK